MLDPSFEDPEMKTAKLRRELRDDIAKIGYAFIALNVWITVPFVWVWDKLRGFRKSLRA